MTYRYISIDETGWVSRIQEPDQEELDRRARKVKFIRIGESIEQYVWPYGWGLVPKGYYEDGDISASDY